MRYRSGHDPHARERLWRRLDRAAGEINPLLTVVAIGLGLLNLTYFVGLLMTMPVTRVGVDKAPVVLPVAGSVGTAGPLPIGATESIR